MSSRESFITEEVLRWVGAVVVSRMVVLLIFSIYSPKPRRFPMCLYSYVSFWCATPNNKAKPWGVVDMAMALIWWAKPPNNMNYHWLKTCIAYKDMGSEVISAVPWIHGDPSVFVSSLDVMKQLMNMHVKIPSAIYKDYETFQIVGCESYSHMTDIRLTTSELF